MSKNYKNGYSNGYAAGCRRSDKAIAHERFVANQAAQRAERAEKQQGLGHCEDCTFWKRGAGSANPENCAWGMCEAPRVAGHPWGVFALADAGPISDAKIQTTPRFGCVVFMAANVISGNGVT